MAETQNQNETCCRITDEGDPYCVTSASGQTAPCGCASEQNPAALVHPGNTGFVPLQHLPERKTSTFWQNARSGVMFGLACITSPCCTPLIVPIILALIAGTPAAVWMSQNLGWVYGGLTLISAISLVLALRWMGQKKTSQSRVARSSNYAIPVISSLATIGDKPHVE